MVVTDGYTGGSAEGGEPPCWVMALTRRQAEYITDLLGMTNIRSLLELGLEEKEANMAAVFGIALYGVGVDPEDGVLVWNKGAERVVCKKDDDGE